MSAQDRFIILLNVRGHRGLNGCSDGDVSFDFLDQYHQTTHYSLLKVRHYADDSQCYDVYVKPIIGLFQSIFLQMEVRN